METKHVASPLMEVPMLEPDSVRQLRQLRERGWRAKRIARELGITRNTVRRYLRGGSAAEKQERPSARALDDEGQKVAIAADGAGWATTRAAERDPRR